jgi:hypothetical protein
MSLRLVYLLWAAVGTVVPYVPFMQWLRDQPMDAGIAGRFTAELFSTRIGAFFGLDVLVAALVLFVFVAVERRAGCRARIWTVLLGTLGVGVSLGLPLYLYERERARQVVP